MILRVLQGEGVMASNPLEVHSEVTMLDGLTKVNERLRTTIEDKDRRIKEMGAVLRNLLVAIHTVYSDAVTGAPVNPRMIPDAIEAGWAALGEEKK
jgi:hypothetical protein